MLASGGRVDAAGRATASRGSRNGVLLTGHPGAVVPTGPASASPCGAVLRSKSSRPTSLGVGLGAGVASPHVPHRPQVAVSDSATDSASGLSPEEEQAYQEMMAARKAERKAWKQEMRRRAKFDPMAAPKRPGMTVANAPAGANASADAGPTGAASASPAPALSRPRAPAPSGSAAQPKAPAPGASTPPPAVAAAAAAASLRVKLPRPGPPPPLQPQPAAPGATSATSPAARRREQAAAAAADDGDLEAGMAKRPAPAAAGSAAAGAAAADVDDELDLDGMAAMARKIMADGDDDSDEADGELQAVEEPSGSSRRPAAAPRAAAGAVPVQPRRPGAPAPKRALMPIAQLQRQRAAAAAAAAAAEGQQQKQQQKQQPGAGSAASASAAVRSAAAGGKRAAAAPLRRPAAAEPAAADEEDDLDWDALEAYEKYEQYVNEVTEEEARAARVAARRASSSAASTSSPSSPAASAATGKVAKLAKGRSSKAAAAGRKAGADPEDALDSQLDQWEQLLNFFEVVEKDGKREEARRRKAEAEAAAAAAAAEEAEGGAAAKPGKGGKGAVAAKAAAGAAAGGAALAAELEALGLLGEDAGEEDDEARGEVEVDWQSMERLFLGEGWEAELAELKAKVEASAQEVDAVMAAAEAEEGGAGPVEGWRDEVSTLLLGLVEISAKRYLGRSLLADTPAAKAAAAAAAANPAPPPPPPAPQAGAAAGAANSMGAAAAAAASASPLPEEERPVAFWEAPFMLLVQDDSEDPQLEYANRTALQALGWAAFDDATGGVSAASLADATHPASQAEWLWACTDAAERPEQFSTIPSLRLRGPHPGAPAVLASGVTVFRVDSLEGEPIGQAVLVESWRRLSDQEAAADDQ